MTGSGRTQRERSTTTAVRILVWIARRLGRRAATPVLAAVAAYFMAFAPAARRASRDYLRRVLGRKPRLREQFRHFFCFARVALDRAFLLSEDFRTLDVRRTDADDVFERHGRSAHGVLIMVAHLGSFEALRVFGQSRDALALKVLMDRAAGARANAVLEGINPGLGASIIDTADDDVDRVLKLRKALSEGYKIGLMADRAAPGERTAACPFLGDTARFPLAPWLLAGMLGAPVILAFGLYRGGNRYEVHVEPFSEGRVVPRAERQEQARADAERFARRLEAHARAEPYNWFNFYDFWARDAASA